MFDLDIQVTAGTELNASLAPATLNTTCMTCDSKFDC
ncbi:FDLD family class I lanthipeptide [Tumebacillus amylolyticus]